ncbi:MAG TPA: endonuclease/exonuclease/phosphatase family protein [Micromonosporaceae bacterium]|nr:endonuclease/exonuclease/phosphatase family protein [Micromonosporaceae bacterium]
MLTLNLQAAALPRAKQLLTWLDTRDDDLLMLTETSRGGGTTHVLDQCRAAGLSVIDNAGTDGDRGCAIISRVPITARPDLLPTVTLPGRAVAATIDSDPAITVLGLYVPSGDRTPDKVANKQAFLASVLNDLREFSSQQRAKLVVGGDYNVIARDHHPRYSLFLPFEYEFLDRLVELGLTDAYQRLQPTAQAHSWFGRDGSGYRFDYFHVGVALIPALVGCDYLQDPRERGLTDHAGVTLTLRVSSQRIASDGQGLASAGALF